MVIGTRPEAVKMAPVVQALRRRAPEVTVEIALTGQHGPLVDQAMEAFDLTPDHVVGVMTEGQTLYDIGHRCLDGLRDAVRKMKPDVLLVQGDTATVFFGSLVAFFEKVPVGHVEAGLRSGDRNSPFPEEMFRRMTDALSVVHFAPTPESRGHLIREGIEPAGVFVTGNTVVDALVDIGATDAGERTPQVAAALRDCEETGSRLVVLTAHRRESFGEPLREIFSAVRAIADRHPDIRIVFPVHPNPHVVEAAAELLEGHPRIQLLDPVPYLDLIHLLRHASLVLTDSGGIQEEAPTFGVPVLVLREVTERPEGVRAGVAQLVGSDGARILEAADAVLSGGPRAFESSGKNPYGDGQAGERIADILLHRFRGSARTTSDWASE